MSHPMSDRVEMALLAIPDQLLQLQSVGGDLAGQVSPPPSSLLLAGDHDVGRYRYYLLCC